MAAVNLISSAITTPGKTSPVLVNGSFVLQIPGNAVFDGARVQVLAWNENNAAEMAPAGQHAVMTGPMNQYFAFEGENYIQLEVTGGGANLNIPKVRANQS